MTLGASSLLEVGGDHVACGHMVGNEPFAFHVILDELVPANAGAELDPARNADDVNAITIGFGPTVLDPAAFADFADGISIFWHTEATPLSVVGTLFFNAVGTNAIDICCGAPRFAALSVSYNGGAA